MIDDIMLMMVLLNIKCKETLILIKSPTNQNALI